MSEPEVRVLGIYRLDVTDELALEQQSILYPASNQGTDRAESEKQIREQLDSVVLIEAQVIDRDNRFDISDFTQAQVGAPPDGWQVAWAEAYLSPDGNSLVVERWAPMPDAGDLRVAFFFHYWDRTLPLQSSYGDIVCPEPQPMPDRLRQLVPYICAD